MSIINRIRSKSPQARGLFAFWFAVGITGCIALVWSTTVPARLQQAGTITKDNGAFGELGDSLKTATDQVANTINTQVKEVTEESRSSLEKLAEEARKQEFGTSTTETATATDPIEALSTSTPVTELENTSLEEEKPQQEEKPRVILIGTTTVQKEE